MAAIGYGDQGCARALTLRDSGAEVFIANVKDTRAERAASDGFRVIEIGGRAREAEIRYVTGS